MSKLPIIGRVEKISFPDFGLVNIHAKIDTGADLSSIWATDIYEHKGALHFKLLGPKSDHFTGEEIIIEAPDFMLTRVANSFGHKELRYVLKLKTVISGKKIKASYTLANRGTKTYSVLIGRSLLNKKFLVDVSIGAPLEEVENKKKSKMQREIEAFKKWEESK